MTQTLHRVWQGPVGFAEVSLPLGGPYYPTLAAVTPCTLAVLAARIKAALDFVTSIAWTVHLSSDYTITISCTLGPFSWTSLRGFDAFWGWTDGINLASLSGTAWTAADQLGAGCVVSMPIVALHRQVIQEPTAPPAAVLYGAHMRRVLLTRCDQGAAALSRMQGGPVLLHQGSESEWTIEAPDGYLVLRPASQTVQSPRTLRQRVGEILEHRHEFVDLTVGLPS